MYYVANSSPPPPFDVIPRLCTYNRRNCSNSADEDARKAMMLNGGYIRGVKVETSLSSAVEKRTAVNNAASREMRLPYHVPNRDPRLRNMLYRLHQQTDSRGGIINHRTAVPQPAADGFSRGGSSELTAASYFDCGDVRSGLSPLSPQSSSERERFPAVTVVTSARGHRTPTNRRGR